MPTKPAKTKAVKTKPVQKKSGLAYWMLRVLEECNRAGVAFAPDPVHDLRVALRRCRSMADGMAAVDPDPAWKEMKKAGKRLFGRLGELRDVQVMQEWVHRLDSPDDPVTAPLLQSFAIRETPLQQQAVLALAEFDRKQWLRWSRSLPRRMARFRLGGPIFRHLALERWTAAHKLHRQALRSGAPAAFHRLRIGIKRFRYIVENFLPEQHAAWGDDLKHMQDLLGEVHDLDVLWPAAVLADVFPDSDARLRWQNRISQERAQRIQAYLKKMMDRPTDRDKDKVSGRDRNEKDSLWQLWRRQLPDRKQTESIALLRLKLWASLLDPDFKHSRHVARLTLQLYDGLTPLGKPSASAARERAILQAAALLHDVGMADDEKGHHKASYRMIRRLAPPLGWRAQDLHTAGIIARYHRGALPRAGQKTLVGLSIKEKQDISRLAAILRLANAFDASRDGRIQRLQVADPSDGNKILLIAAQGYSTRDNQAEAVAAARHLLETVYRRPVMVKPLRISNPKRSRRPETRNRKQPADA
jgi:CHAD domain-containing protein/HD superfamily phosphodiesterase